jgi:hypothetical protein
MLPLEGKVAVITGGVLQYGVMRHVVGGHIGKLCPSQSLCS